MQHFFFNYRDHGILVRDYEGTTLADLDEAVARAAEMASNMKAAAASGADIDSRQIEICDEAGITVQVVSIHHAEDERRLPRFRVAVYSKMTK